MSARTEIEAIQERKLRRLLGEIVEGNSFYRRKLAGFDRRHAATFTLRDLQKLPTTAKEELLADQRDAPPFGSNLTYPLDRYVRLHQTSGTSGRPLRWLDTAESWSWWLDCWLAVYRRAGVGRGDRVFVAFSFGPFIGFWTAFEAAQRAGALAITGGAQSSQERLDQMIESGATVLVSTPTYALRLAEVAREQGRSTRDLGVRLTLHAGEPGASVPNVRRRIEEAWGARAVDHAGATEVGAWGVRGPDDEDMVVLEHDFVAEVLEIGGDAPASPAADGTLHGELVLTNLGRLGSPVLRYRTGDVVRLVGGGRYHALPADHLGAEDGATAPDSMSAFARLRGGILSRADGMIVVRGINVYPSAIENLVREVREIEEFRVVVRRGNGLARLCLEIEVPGSDGAATATRLAELLHRQLHLTAEIEPVGVGTLPRYELKARRFAIVDE
jgi:phenylacetate-CoA ligase